MKLYDVNTAGKSLVYSDLHKWISLIITSRLTSFNSVFAVFIEILLI